MDEIPPEFSGIILRVDGIKSLQTSVELSSKSRKSLQTSAESSFRLAEKSQIFKARFCYT